jgi:hypothetical protein
MMRFFRQACALTALSLALTGAAFAQIQPNGHTEPCVNGSSDSGDLSNKLSQSNGVICPPDIDQGMKAPTPNTGKMPVIPPPGSPGGNQNMQPK